MQIKPYDIMDLAIDAGAVEQGSDIQPGKYTRVLTGIKVLRVIDHEKGRRWTLEEDNFLRQNLGWITEEAMSEILGRSVIGIHLRWSRDLHLTAPSKAPDVITAERAAIALGLDAHKITHWVDKGLIPGRRMSAGRTIRLIRRDQFKMWVCNPQNWVWFDIRKIVDPKLKRLCAKRAKRWGDEWWTTRQAADYHGLITGDITRYIHLGRLPSVRLPISLGGRDHDRTWSNHRVLKSDVIKMKVYRGMGRGPKQTLFTPRADAWLLRARDKLGMTFLEIGRTMKIGHPKVNRKGHIVGTNEKISGRYKYLKLLRRIKKSKGGRNVQGT